MNELIADYEARIQAMKDYFKGKECFYIPKKNDEID